MIKDRLPAFRLLGLLLGLFLRLMMGFFCSRHRYRVAKQIKETHLPGFGPLHVVPDISELMKIDMDGVVFVFDIMGDPVIYFFIFRLVGTKEAIPDDKSGRKIFVDVFLLTAMMHPVIGGRGKNVFDNRMQFGDVFGMHPKLKQHRHLVHDK